MSKYPSIPDFTEDPQSMANALRALKDTVEQLAGQRQGASLGAPAVYFQAAEPVNGVRSTLSRGDFWVDEVNQRLSCFDGRRWVRLG